MSEPQLAADFAPVSLEDWAELVRAKDPQAPLVTELDGGLEVHWLYGRADALAPDPGGLPGHAPFTRGTRVGARWAIRQENAAPRLAEANRQILEDLEGGASEVLLRIDPTGRAGVPVADADDLAEVLNGVLLQLAPVALDAGVHAVAAAGQLAELWRGGGVDPAQQRGSLRLDPIGTLAHGQTDSGALAEAMREAFSLAVALRSEFPRAQLLAVDTAVHVEAGADAVEELALALATGIAYLRAADDGGIGPEHLASRLELTLTAGTDQFLEIAKFRAARRLWSTVLGHCGVAEAHRRSPTYARTSRRMVSSLDPWVNLLRATTAAFAAGVGGADGVTVLPFDEARGEGIAPPGELGRRLARNTQLVLMEEASLHAVADPAGGSWYVESLTDQLARRAWSRLQELEGEGGIVTALSSGALAERLAGASARRHSDIAHRRAILTGVNAFPLLGEDGLAREAGAVTPLAGRRDASSFEALRARAGAVHAALGREPAVLLACLGPIAAHVSVAMWATSFFEAGGVRAIPSGAVSDDAAQATLLAEHRLSAAVICAGRDTPGEARVSLAAALRAAGARVLYLAGADDDAARAIGADLGVVEGVDMVAVLADLLDRIEAAGTEAPR